jgi:hypothetical protein
MSRALLKRSGGSVEILRDVRHCASKAEALIARPQDRD